MSADDFERDEPVEAYEPPAVEDLDTGSGPAVTAAGFDSIQVS
jgi:hypothetical protein